MTTYRTGNAIGSADPRDLYDNAENLDEFVNSQDKVEHPDRLGVPRKTWHGMEQEFVDAQADKQQRFNLLLANSGYEYLADYAAGIEITEYNQVLRDAAGELWRAAATTTLPYTTDGTGLPEGGAFVAVGDADIRNDLAAGVGAGKGGLLVRGAVIYVNTVADLQALDTSGLVDGQQVQVREYHATTGVGGGEFYWDATSEEADNGGTVFGDAAQGRWKRLDKGFVRDVDFGLVNDPGFTQDQSEKINKIFELQDVKVVFTSSNKYLSTSPILTNQSDKAISITTSGDSPVEFLCQDNDFMEVGSSIKIRNIKVSGASVVFRMRSDLEYFEVEGSLFDNCIYFVSANAVMGRLIVRSTQIENMLEACIFGSGDVTDVIEMSSCRLDNIARYVIRYSISGKILFNDNTVNDVHSRGFSGGGAVARVIQFSGSEGCFMSRNRITNIESGDANSNIVYWSRGDLFVSNNYFDEVRGGGFMFDQKNTDRTFKAVIDSNVFGSIESGVVQYYGSQNAESSCIVTNNTFASVDREVLDIYVGTTTNIGSQGENIVFSNNVIDYKNTRRPIVYVRRGCKNLVVSNNIVNSTNPNDQTIYDFISYDSFVSIINLISESPSKNILIEGNNFAYTEGGSNRLAPFVLSGNHQSSPMDGVVIQNNLVSGATHKMGLRITTSPISFVMKNNVFIGGDPLDFGITPGNPDETALEYYLMEGNVVMPVSSS